MGLADERKKLYASQQIHCKQAESTEKHNDSIARINTCKLLTKTYMIGEYSVLVYVNR